MAGSNSSFQGAQGEEEEMKTDDEILLDRATTETPPILLPLHRLCDYVQLVSKPKSSEFGTREVFLDPVLTEEFGGVDAAIGRTRQACHAVEDSAPTNRGPINFVCAEGDTTIDFQPAMADFTRALTPAYDTNSMAASEWKIQDIHNSYQRLRLWIEANANAPLGHPTDQSKWTDATDELDNRMGKLRLELDSIPRTLSQHVSDDVGGVPNFVRKVSMTTTSQGRERSWEACALERTTGKLLAIKLLEDPPDAFLGGAVTLVPTDEQDVYHAVSRSRVSGSAEGQVTIHSGHTVQVD
jgi:hypothetical protein